MARCKLRRISGRTGGAVCKLAEFKAWKKREISRLAYQQIQRADQSAALIAEIVGVDYGDREHIIAIALDNSMRVLGIADGSSGEKSVCAYMNQDLFKALFESVGAAKQRIGAVIIGHNHPSGDPRPSQSDIDSTAVMICEFAGMNIVDHVIVAPVGNEFSMREGIPEMFRDSNCRTRKAPSNDRFFKQK